MKYTGTSTLENLKEARNYNNFIEEHLAKFIGEENTVLDFGAGTGEFAKRLKSRGINVDCVELDSALREALRADGFIAEADISEIDGSYKRIYSLNVLEHIENDVEALKSLHAKLSEGGQLFLYVPAFNCIYSEFDKKIGHFRRYTAPVLTERLRAAGFKIEKAQYADSLGFFAWMVMKLITKADGEPSRKMIKIYDLFFFPISKLMDIFLKKLVGKNLLVIAAK